jgi:hypothetical protein
MRVVGFDNVVPGVVGRTDTEPPPDEEMLPGLAHEANLGVANRASWMSHPGLAEETAMPVVGQQDPHSSSDKLVTWSMAPWACCCSAAVPPVLVEAIPDQSTERCCSCCVKNGGPVDVAIQTNIISQDEALFCVQCRSVAIPGAKMPEICELCERLTTVCVCNGSGENEEASILVSAPIDCPGGKASRAMVTDIRMNLTCNCFMTSRFDFGLYNGLWVLVEESPGPNRDGYWRRALGIRGDLVIDAETVAHYMEQDAKHVRGWELLLQGYPYTDLQILVLRKSRRWMLYKRNNIMDSTRRNEPEDFELIRQTMRMGGWMPRERVLGS